MTKLVLDRRNFVKLLGISALTMLGGSIIGCSFKVDKLVEAQKCLDKNTNLSAEEKEIISQSLDFLDLYNDQQFEQVKEKLQNLKINYGPKTLGVPVANYVDETILYEKDDEPLEKDVLASALYEALDFKEVISEKVEALLQEGISKTEIAETFLEQNSNLNEEHKEVLRQSFPFLESYVNDHYFADAICTLRALTITENEDKVIKAGREGAVGVTLTPYLVYYYDLENTNVKHTILHEGFHAMTHTNAPDWLEEGMTELLTAEYGDGQITAYSLAVNDIKALSEIVGSEVVLKAYLSGLLPWIQEELMAIIDDEDMANNLLDLIASDMTNVVKLNDFKEKKEYFKQYFLAKYGYEATADVIMNTFVDDSYIGLGDANVGYKINKTYFNENGDNVIIYDDGEIKPLDEVVTRNASLDQKKLN